jgi:lipopolysaccharide biosynthesis glycosyltransferase
MRKVLGILLLCFFANNAIGQEVANCKSPKGKAYYFNMGIVPATKAGWDDDKISGGAITLTKQGNDFDVLYFDVTKK